MFLKCEKKEFALMLYCLENRISSYYINPKLYNSKDVELVILIQCNIRTVKHVS